MPSIPWNSEYIPNTPTPRQLAFLFLPHREALFGGSAGGGKSDALLMSALQYVHVPGYAALLLRRTLSDLKQPEALLDRAHTWLQSTRAIYKAEEHEYRFPTLAPNGSPGKEAILKFGYIGESTAYTRYQGAEFQYVGFDELTQHKLSDYTYLFSRLRKKKCPTHTDEDGILHLDQECPICQVAAGHQGVPLRMRAATNPGGTGHAWTKNRFMITPDKDPIKARQQGVRVTYTGKHPSRPFIPSFVTDNPYLDQEGYIRGLQELSPVERAQLLEGDWGASHDARFNADQLGFYTIRGDYFVLGEGSGRVHPYASLRNIFCTIDPATTSRDGPAQASIKRDVEPSKTVMCAWGLTPDMNLMLLDMSRGMWEAPEVVEAMVAMYKRWNPSTFVCENNGPGKPIHQFASARGIPIKSVHKHKDKVANSFTAQLRVRQGRLWVPEPYTPWKQQFIDEVFTWTGDPDQDNDIVDNLSDACNHVSWDMTQGEGTEEYNLPARQGPFTINTFTSNPFNATM